MTSGLRLLQSRVPSRILMSADTVGGVWTYSLELIRALAPFGIEFILATMGRTLTAEQRKQVHAIPNVQLEESAYKLEWMDESWEEVQRAGDWLLELERRFSPDVVHLNGFSHGSLPWLVPRIVVGHSCVLSWWKAVRRATAPTSWNRYGDAVRRGLRAADLVVAPSASMLAMLQTHYGPLGASKVIFNARALEVLQQRAKEPFVFGAGRIWDPAKNLRALESVAQELPWSVYVAGEMRSSSQPDEHERQAMIGEVSSYNRQVQFLGHLGSDEVISWLERAAIYALPARYEPFGLSVLEAASAGCALVLGDIDSLRELWEDAAVFVPPDEPEVLADALKEVIASAAWRADLSARARRQANRYTSRRMAAQYLEAYRDVLTLHDTKVSERSIVPMPEPTAAVATASMNPDSTKAVAA